MTKSKGVKGRTRQLVVDALASIGAPATPREVHTELLARGYTMSLDVVRRMLHTLRKEPDRRVRIAGYVRSLGTGGPYKATFAVADGRPDVAIPVRGRQITGREASRRYRARHAARLSALRAAERGTTGVFAAMVRAAIRARAT